MVKIIWDICRKVLFLTETLQSKQNVWSMTLNFNSLCEGMPFPPTHNLEFTSALLQTMLKPIADLWHLLLYYEVILIYFEDEQNSHTI